MGEIDRESVRKKEMCVCERDRYDTGYESEIIQD
jgi:hypothetical protein